MTALCLSDDLVKQYLDFKFNRNYDKSLVTKLFKYIQPALVSIQQHKLLQDPSAINQFGSDPIINLINIPTAQVVTHTTLKLKLVTEKDYAVNFTQLNIQARENLERLNMLLAGTHSVRTHKQEAINHIKALLSDAKYVIITDKYISQRNSWSQCQSVLGEILPRQTINITLRTESLNGDNKRALKTLCQSWNIKGGEIGENIHDRYIETDKLKILLSSGVFHLSSKSNTDLTYVVKIKN